MATEANKLSSEVEQLLKRWEREGVDLRVELSSKDMAVFGSVVISSFRDERLLLDCKCGCGYKVSLRDATFEFRLEPVQISENELVINQLQISLEGNQRVLLTENRHL